MNLKRITLGFENVEVVDIPAELITFLQMSGCTSTHLYFGDEMESHLQCDDCEIRLKREAGNIPMEWPVRIDGTEFIPTLWDRINEYRDIVSVDLDYGTHVDTYYVKWPDDGDLENNNCMSVSLEEDEIRISIR